MKLSLYSPICTDSNHKATSEVPQVSTEDKRGSPQRLLAVSVGVPHPDPSQGVLPPMPPPPLPPP